MFEKTSARRRISARSGRRGAAAGLIAGLLLAASCALAATAADGVSVTPFATDFPNAKSIGPIGLAFDGSSRLFVADGGYLYRFGTAGGQAGPSTRVNSSALSGKLTGLAFGAGGRLYAGEVGTGGRGDVVELDPEHGTIVRKVVSGLPCPVGIAADPVSGDLFVSEVDCGRRIVRVHDPASSSPSVSTFASGLDFDGLTFGPDGTLWAAHAPDASGNTVARIDGVGSADPGRITEVSAVPKADGIALSAAGSVGGHPDFLVVNRQDGKVTRVDLADAGHPTATLMTGGSRGDLAAVGPDGCLYVTQTDSVLRLTNADGSCTTSPSAPAPTSGGDQNLGALTPTVTTTAASSRRPACRGTRTVRIHLAHPSRLRAARIYRGHRLIKKVSGRALRRAVVLKRVPRAKVTLTIRATTRTGHHTVSHRTLKRDRRCR